MSGLSNTASGSNDSAVESSDQSPDGSAEKSDSKDSLQRSTSKTMFEWGKIKLRTDDDNEEQDWWFASTAIPLIAATIGPMANVTSIAALVSPWRMDLTSRNHPDGPPLKELYGRPYPDPNWAYNINLASLVCGFVGNVFLLFNFTNRIRYIIALPMTILLWYMSAGFLMGITISMNVYAAPQRPYHAYTSAYWQGVIAAALYMVCAMILMVNMLGYFLGHYPQHFNLTESQRTLILQTMMFFIWLAGGAAIFQAIEEDDNVYWSFSNALYFCDVTILTVGFGDVVPSSDVGRGILFPYSVGGIIMLGLVISSISTFAGELSYDHVIRRRLQVQRQRKVNHSVPLSPEVPASSTVERPPVSTPFDGRTARTAIIEDGAIEQKKPSNNTVMFRAVRRVGNAMALAPRQRRPRRNRLVVLQKEKDRFDAMREVQKNTEKFKKWSALTISVSIFGMLWCVGAVVFWIAERHQQPMNYFQALYFCYVSLLTIGYGDFAPVSAAGRPFFILWSLLAVPSMTILIGNMGNTIIAGFKQGTNYLADFTVLPKEGIWRAFVEKHPWLLWHLQKRAEKRAAEQRLEHGFGEGPEDEDREAEKSLSIQELASQARTEHELAKRLAGAIKRVSKDFKGEDGESKKYSYEEWADFTELIKFTSRIQEPGEQDEEDGLIDWDWIGESSPMMTTQSEPEWLLDRLCESMSRYVRHKAPRDTRNLPRGKASARAPSALDDVIEHEEVDGPSTASVAVSSGQGEL